MFRDLKEYQEIQRIYQNNVYDSPDDKLFEEAFKEFNTLEELDYLEENVDYLFEGLGSAIGSKVKGALNYINKLKKGLKLKPGNVKPKDVSKELEKAKDVINKSKNVTPIKPNNKVTDIVKVDKTPKVDASKVKVDTPKVKVDNKSGVDKIKDAIKNNPGKTAAVGTGALVTTAALTPGGEEKKDETPKVEEKPKEEPKVEVKKEEPKKEKKKKEKPLLSTPIKDTTKLGSKVRQVKPGSARDKAIATNEVRHGSDHVVNLRNQNADFQAMKKGKITKAQFIAMYPKSQTAKKHKLKNIKRGIKSSYDPIYNNNLANNLAEVYRNMYNTPGEENIQESPYGQMTKMRMDKVKDLPKGPKPSKPDTAPEQKRPDTAPKPNKPSKPSPEPTKPTRPTPRPDTGNQGPKTRRPLPKPPIRTGPEKFPAKMTKEDFGFDAYDLILEYLLGTEQVETIEEANYVMTEMDDQTIHSIVTEMEDALNEINEGMLGNVAKGVASGMGAASGMAGDAVRGSMGAARKLMQTLKNLPKGVKKLGQPKPPFKSTKDFDFRPGSMNNPLPPKMKPMSKSGGGMNPSTGM